MMITLQDYDYTTDVKNEFANNSDALYKLDDVFGAKDLFTTIDELLYSAGYDASENEHLENEEFQIGGTLLDKGYCKIEDDLIISGDVEGLENSDFDVVGLILDGQQLYVAVAF